jgi:hypothetical protein
MPERKQMSGYAIMRFAKSSGGAGGIEAHHERLKVRYKSNPDIHTDRSRFNYHLIEPQGRYNSEIRSHIDAAKERNPKLIMKSNSVLFVDVLITATPHFFQMRPKEFEREYFRAALSFFEDKVKHENIISAVVHRDEETPHMHLVFVPITDDDRLSAKDIIGGPAGCRKWQDEFFGQMSKVFPDLMRGRAAELTGRTHLPSEVFKVATASENIDQRYREKQELQAHRRYIKSIPDDIKEEIVGRQRETHKGKQGRQERERGFER